MGTKNIHIIGSGWTRGNVDHLQNEITIAVNFEMFLCPWAIFGVFLDRAKRIEERGYDLQDFSGLVFTRASSEYRGSNAVILPVKNDEYGTDFASGVCCNMMSGMVALNIALLMTSGKVILHGYDLNDDGTGNPYHAEHPNYNYQGKIIYNSTAVKGNIERYHMVFENHAHRIYNASKTSALEFQKWT